MAFEVSVFPGEGPHTVGAPQGEMILCRAPSRTARVERTIRLEGAVAVGGYTFEDSGTRTVSCDQVWIDSRHELRAGVFFVEQGLLLGRGDAAKSSTLGKVIPSSTFSVELRGAVSFVSTVPSSVRSSWTFHSRKAKSRSFSFGSILPEVMENRLAGMSFHPIPAVSLSGCGVFALRMAGDAQCRTEPFPRLTHRDGPVHHRERQSDAYLLQRKASA